MNKHFFSFILVFSLGVCTHPVFSATISFPDDTMQRFIKQYGKDALIKRIDASIVKSEKLIAQYQNELRIESIAKEVHLMSRHFNSKLDTLSFPNVESIFPVGRMYGMYFGDKANLAELDKMARKNAADNPVDTINQYFMDNLYDEKLRTALTMYCEQLPVSISFFDTVYEKSLAFTIPEKIKVYHFFSEVDRNCSSKLPLLKNLKDSLFTQLYKDYSLSKVLGDSTMLDSDNIFQYNIHYPIKLLAYGLYGGNISLSNSGKELMSLLQISDGGWRELNYKDDIPHYPAIIYSTWAMYEYRSQLKALKK